MSARRRSGGFLRRLVEAVKHVRGVQAGGRRGPGGRRRQLQCPTCRLFVRAICQDAEEGAEPCRLGLDCGCCFGPHRAEKGPDGGKFTTSVERA